MATRPTPKPDTEHNELIDALGGPSEVAELMTEHLHIDPPLTRGAVGNWKNRGIPHAYRPTLYKLAKLRKLKVSKYFLGDTLEPQRGEFIA